MRATPAQFKIDGVWVQCYATEDFGALGQRFLCDFAKAPGEPQKLMLLRLKDWTQVSLPNFVAPIPLVLKPGSDARPPMLRAVKGKLYQRTLAMPDGKSRAEPCSVLQQDVSGLLSLRDAILRAKKAGDTPRIWQLFFGACKTLNRFGKTFGGGQPVPLQCPGSLAVESGGRIVLLDAEIRVGAAAAAPDAKQLYQTWFGEKGGSGAADAKDASLMHSRALLLFFRQLLGGSPQQPAGAVPAALAKAIVGLGQVPLGIPLDEMEEWVRNNGED